MSAVTILSASRLWLLVLLVPAVAFYVVRQRMRQRYVVVLPTAALLELLAPRRFRWWRHLPALLVGVSVAATVLALARPAVAERVPRRLDIVIVALDISNSMLAADVRPSRLVVARDAALDFARSLPRQVRVGLVTFAGDASVRVVPTTDRRLVARALRITIPADGTAIGEAVFRSLEAIRDAPVDGASAPAPSERRQLPPSGIVLLSDGDTTLGRSHIEAARAARQARVRVSTISYGTRRGVIVLDGHEVPVPSTSTSLRQLARRTDGTFQRAPTSAALRDAYDQLSQGLGTRRAYREVTSLVLLAAFFVLLAAGVGAALWSERVP
jgi:Ca-activated chloride channel family protein